MIVRTLPDGDCDDCRVIDLRLAHTADLDPATLAELRMLLENVFAGDFDEHDWEHALGGIHAIAREGPEVVGHASVVQRRLLYGGRALRAGYVEGVGVRADRRRRGYGRALMSALDRVILGGYDLGALGTTDDAVALYESLGWHRWLGPTAALTPDGIVRTADEDGAVYVRPAAVRLDPSAELTCDWRDGSLW
jgi:aminoglycoside 2'-N-acetyltransferase I